MALPWSVVLQAPDLPSLGRQGPDDLRRLLDLFFLLVGVGLAVASAGHLYRSRALVAVGVALVLAGTVTFLIAVGTHG